MLAMRALVASILALAVVPLVDAGTGSSPDDAVPTMTSSVTPSDVDTVLYFHPIHIQDMPLNTQRPPYDPRFTDSGRYAPTAATVTCLDPTTGDLGGTGVGTGGTTSQDHHTWRSYSSASYVEYDYTSADGSPRTHPERVLSYDIPLNQSSPVVLHWFLAEYGTGQEGADRAPLSNVVVRVVVRNGNPVSVDDRSYDQGAVVMQGETAPVTAFAGEVTGDGAGQVTASQVGDRWVYGFAVPLTLQAQFLNRSTGFNVRIDAFSESAACPDGGFMASTATVFADAAHQPRIELRNGKPLDVGAAAVFANNGTVTLAWDVNSGWGNYDVDVANATLRVSGPVDVAPALAYTIQRYREHYHIMDPVEQAWTLDAQDLPDGRYAAVFTVPNLQRTATAEARLTFFIEDGRLVDHGPKEASGPGAILLITFLACVAAVLRRRP